MRKRILIVSTNSQARSSAENTLRHNGYEVVSVDSAQRSEGILGVSDFDLILVGHGTPDDTGGFYFDSWLRGPQIRNRPFLIFSDSGESPMGVPQEMIIPPNASPADLLTAVSRKIGAGLADESLFPGASSDDVDSILDAALGLDQIEVQSSETMGNETSQIIKKKKSESLVGYEAEVTSITSTQHNLTDTSKIDLALAMNKTPPTRDTSKNIPEEEQLNIASHNFSTGRKSNQKTVDLSSSQANEFVDMLREDLAPSGARVTKDSAAEEDVFQWGGDSAGSPSSPSSAEISQVFSQQMASEIAERVAAKLVSQLNSEKFIALIQKEIQNYLKSKS